MTTNKIVSLIFYTAAFYDFMAGVLFLFAGPAIFEMVKVAPPSHWGYVEFPSLILMIFGVMFWQVAQKPEQNRNLIPYGVMIKFSYASVVIWHWAQGNMPEIWKPFSVIDVIFLICFLWAMNAIARANKPIQTY